MTLNEYNRFCRSLTATTHVVQWGGAHVWKIGAKVFAIGGWHDDEQELFVTFKCSDMSYAMLKDVPGCRPAPYLASRGMMWIQRTSAEALDDGGLKEYLRASYNLVIAGLPKRLQQEIGVSDKSMVAKPKSRSSTETARSSGKATDGATAATSKTKAGSTSTTKPGSNTKPTATAATKASAQLARTKPRKGVRT